MVEVGLGRISNAQVAALLAEPRGGARAPRAAAAHGLYLVDVQYPYEAFVPQPPGNIFRPGAQRASGAGGKQGTEGDIAPEVESEL